MNGLELIWGEILNSVAPPSFKPLLAAFVAVAIWGASPAATAIAGRSIPAELIAGLRTLLGGVVLLPLIFHVRNRFPPRGSARLEFVTGAIFGFVAYPLTLSFGVLKTSVIHASVILAAAPIFTGLLSFLITGKWPRARWWTGGMVCLAGIGLLMASRGSAAGSLATLWGDALVLLSVMFASVGYVFGGRGSALIGQWPATALSIGIGALAFAPLTLASTAAFDWSGVARTDLAALLFLVIMVTIVGYALWFYALAGAGAAKVAPLQFLQPVIGVALAALLLGETILPTTIMAGMLVIAGVWLTRRA